MQKLSQPRVRLGHLPTPLEPMDRLRAALGPTCPALYVKRDDCTGLATGGNKTRKLEFLMGEALHRGAKAVVTFGALQSNHARQTAAAAAKLGLLCDLILTDMVPNDSEAYRSNGNLLLDRVLGARIHGVKCEDAAGRLQQILQEHKDSGRECYVVPVGGSNATGSLGYVEALRELTLQAEAMKLRVDRVVHASSSCGTQAGLIAGSALMDSKIRIHGVNVYKKSGTDIAASAHLLAQETLVLVTGSPRDVSDRVNVVDGYLGEGYGIPTDAMREAVLLAAQAEGLLLDPVYSGKAMAALIGHVRSGKFSPEENIVFWHTGGAASLSAYPEQF